MYDTIHGMIHMTRYYEWNDAIYDIYVWCIRSMYYVYDIWLVIIGEVDDISYIMCVCVIYNKIFDIWYGKWNDIW